MSSGWAGLPGGGLSDTGISRGGLRITRTDCEHTVERTHAYAPYQRRSDVRRRDFALEGLQPGAALNAYVTALDVTTEGVLIVDRAGLVVYANAASEALCSCGALVGRRLTQLMPVDRRTLRRVLSELRRDQVWRGTLPLRRGDKQIDLAVALHTVTFMEPANASTRVTASNRRPHHFCLVAGMQRGSQDAALSAVGRVAGEIAHDFNNQIAVVLNYSFILLRQLPNDSPLREHVAEMQNAAWRASQVAQEMLGFGGQRSPEADDIDLNALLRDVQALFAFTLREDARFEHHLAENLWHVRARRAHLEWLLVELASRMRMTLGPLDRFCITTCNSDATRDQSVGTHATNEWHVATEAGDSRAAQDRWVTISIEGHNTADTKGRVSSIIAAQEPALGADGLRGAEVALAHAQGDLAAHRLPDGGLRYRIRLPAV